jgi:protein-tyrosine phosphatase
MAEAMFRTMVKNEGLQTQIQVDSAGISSEEQGNPPHPGAQAVLEKHGIDFSGIVSRPITPKDFGWADLIIGMDSQNIHYLKQLSPEADKKKIHLCLDIIPTQMGQDIPDPWYDHKFGRTYSQLSESLPKWLDYIKTNFL